MISNFVTYSFTLECLGRGEKKKKKKNREEKRVGEALNSRILRVVAEVIFLTTLPRGGL